MTTTLKKENRGGPRFSTPEYRADKVRRFNRFIGLGYSAKAAARKAATALQSVRKWSAQEINQTNP